MPFTVSCPKCRSRFLLGDDLYRRKVSGHVVTVKCRNCEAEISVDARDLDTMRSHEVPKRSPAPPRPKGPANPAASEQISKEAASIWDSDDTVSLPVRPAPGSVPEFLDFEEVPASSIEEPKVKPHAAPHSVHPPRRQRPADDYLSTIDPAATADLALKSVEVNELASAAAIHSTDFDIDTAVTRRKGTMPLFDMSGVLPAANPDAQFASSSSAPMMIDFGPAQAPVTQAKDSARARERKYVIAPEQASESEGATPKSRRRGAFVVLLACGAAAGLLLVVALRRHPARQNVALAEAPPTADPSQSAASASAEPVTASAAERTSVASDAEGPAQSGSSEADAPQSPVPAAATADPKPTVVPSVERSQAREATTAKPESTAANPAATAANPAAANASVKPSAAAGAALGKAQPVTEAALPPAGKDSESGQPDAEFDRGAAVNALKAAASQASSCRKDGDPSGTASLTITFANSGRVTSATIQGPPFAGTATGGCIASVMRHAQVPAFSGDRVTVTKTVVIE